jgi:hypothetical protein
VPQNRGIIMRISNFILLIVALSSLVFSTQANAGLPTGETVVRAIDLPDNENLKRKDGTYVDLGYHFLFWNGGEWVGYIGSSREYLKLNEHDIKVLVSAAGLHTLPEIPSRPLWSTLIRLFYTAIFLFAPIGWWRARRARIEAFKGDDRNQSLDTVRPEILDKIDLAASEYRNRSQDTVATVSNSIGNDLGPSGPRPFGKRK